MCGIAGIKFFSSSYAKSDEERLLKALKVQSHRGPDYEAVHSLGKVVFGHNRLAIIDLNERSNQPFRDESGRYSLVFNGEIYNYPELKNNLLQKGYLFNTSSDTEVLLYHLIAYGAKGVDELNGCFAFGFYDSEEDYLLLARDHLGINPLLFSIQQDSVLFASELSPLLSLGVPFEINKKALSAYFKFTYVPAPHTMVAGIHKLLPGHYLEVKGGDLNIEKYWSPESGQAFQGTYEEAKSECKRILTDAVLRRMVADVPLGTFLSGGVDSSIVSALSASFKEDLNTFSIGFKDAGFFDESEYALKVAERISSQHHAINLTHEEVKKDLLNVLNSFDEPFGDSSAIAMYFLSKYAKKRLTVCLSGDGADELLAGYNKHQAFLYKKKSPIVLKVLARVAVKAKRTDRNSKLTNKIRQLKKFGLLSKLAWPNDYWFLASFVSDDDRYKLLKQPELIDLPKSYDDKNSLQNFLLKDQTFVLPNDMLKKVDLMSMAHSLEVRTPFLDKEFVKFANSLPDQMKVKQGKGKIILRDAFGEMLPSDIFTRAKQGFEVPLESWIKMSWDEIIKKEWFNSDYIEQQGVFKSEKVKEIKEKLFSKYPEESSIQMWLYIVFQSWYSKW